MDLLKLLVKCGFEITDEVKEKVKQAQDQFLIDYVKKSDFDNKQTELDAFKEQVEKLKQDKTKLNESLEQSKGEFENFKNGLEKEKLNNEKTSLLKTKFGENGLMNEKLISLLLKGVDLDTIEIKDNDIVDFSKIIDPIKEDYADFFGEVKEEGTPPIINPTPNKPTFTIDSIKEMSEQEINDNWDTIQTILQQ